MAAGVVAAELLAGSGAVGAAGEACAPVLVGAGRQRRVAALDPGGHVAHYERPLEIARQQVIALGIDRHALARGIGSRQSLDEARHRPARHDRVLLAIEDEGARAEGRRRGQRLAHQIDEPVQRVRSRVLDHQRVVAQGAQHRQIVRGEDAHRNEVGRPAHLREEIGEPQAGALEHVHRRAAPHRRRRQDHPVRRALAVAGANRRENGDGAAHALAQEIDRHAGIAVAQQPRRRHRVIHHLVGAGPVATLRRSAEAALIVGEDRDAARGGGGAGVGEGVRVVVEAVERQDDGARRGIGQPAPQRQHGAVAGDDPVMLELRCERR